MEPRSAKRPRIKPGPLSRAPDVSAEQLRFLQRLGRLRVLTPSQAHWLVEAFSALNEDTQRPRTERNTRKRLQLLEREGYIRASLTRPEKGGFSGIYYRLAYRGLVALGIPHELSLLRPPAPHILRYLLFRNDVYAAARQAGWYVGSPVLNAPAVHEALLKRFHAYVTRQYEKRVEQRLPGAELELQRLPAFLPKVLTFEFLLKLDERNYPAELVLLVLDDPRRAIVPDKRRAPRVKRSKQPCPQCSTPMNNYTTPDRAYLRCPAAGCGAERELPAPAQPQLTDLPHLLPNARLLLRDTLSRYDVGAGRLIASSPRLATWRRVLAKRYGAELLATDTLFPELWAYRVLPPAEKRSGASISSNPVVLEEP
jgi:hypothetical protein